MAFWLVPPEDLMEKVRSAGLDVHSGLRGIGYATRMMLPLFMTCDTLDFSHTIGSVNSPWNAIFVYERYPHGLGFTEKAYNLMHLILPRVLDNISQCTCDDGCPCCVGKPLRQYATWDVERGEASIPHKAPARMILEGFLGDSTNLENDDLYSLSDTEPASAVLLEQALRRRLERMREPEVFHPILPEPQVDTSYPDREEDEDLPEPDSAKRKQRHRAFDRGLHKRIAKKIAIDKLSAGGEKTPLEDGDPGTARDLPKGMQKRGGTLKPTAFPGRPEGSGQRSEIRGQRSEVRGQPASPPSPDGSRGYAAPGKSEDRGRKDADAGVVVMGDRLAARARKRYKKKRSDDDNSS
jgi:hypothetical protein